MAKVSSLGGESTCAATEAKLRDVGVHMGQADLVE
jgi:hypothetical protein